MGSKYVRCILSKIIVGGSRLRWNLCNGRAFQFVSVLISYFYFCDHSSLFAVVSKLRTYSGSTIIVILLRY